MDVIFLVCYESFGVRYGVVLGVTVLALVCKTTDWSTQFWHTGDLIYLHFLRSLLHRYRLTDLTKSRFA